MNKWHKGKLYGPYMTKLERIGAAKTPHEKRLLELIRNSKADGGK